MLTFIWQHKHGIFILYGNINMAYLFYIAERVRPRESEIYDGMCNSEEETGKDGTKTGMNCILFLFFLFHCFT